MDWQTIGMLAGIFAVLLVLGRFMPRGGGC